MKTRTNNEKRSLTEKQKKALERFSFNYKSDCPVDVHIRTLSTLIERGVLEHWPDKDLPFFQPIKMGKFRRVA